MTTVFVVLLAFAGPIGPASDGQAQPVTVRATGVGRPPARLTGTQARLMARRAAEVVAVRNLAAKLAGRSHDCTGGNMPTNTMRTVMRGYRYVSAKELPDGTVEVVVEVTVRDLPGKAVEVVSSEANWEMELRSMRQALLLERRRLELRIEHAEREVATLAAALRHLEAVLSEVDAELSGQRRPDVIGDGLILEADCVTYPVTSAGHSISSVSSTTSSRSSPKSSSQRSVSASVSDPGFSDGAGDGLASSAWGGEKSSRAKTSESMQRERR